MTDRGFHGRGFHGALLLGLFAAGCGSVQLPRERYWRLDLPVPAGSELPHGGILRVEDLQLANALHGDCLLQAIGEAQLEPLEHERWIAPLERLVTDAVVLGLSRTRSFELVKGAGDAGREDQVLHGRVVDFAVHRGGRASSAHAVFEFWLEREGQLAFHDEFAASVPLAGDGPLARDSAAAGVAALAQALQQVLDQLGGRMRQAGVFARAAESTPSR